MPASGKSWMRRAASASCLRRMTSRARSSVTVYGSSSLRGVLAAVLHVRAEAPDVGDDGLAGLGIPERARQREQLVGVGQRDVVHLLAGLEACEARLLLVVLGADLH